MPTKTIRLAVAGDDGATYIDCDVETCDITAGDVEEFLFAVESSAIPVSDLRTKFIFSLIKRVYGAETEVDLTFNEATVLYQWLGKVLKHGKDSENLLFTIGVYESALEMFTSKRKTQ